jgi:hypothetical protein
MTTGLDSSRCLNCGTALERNYCPQCGQKSGDPNPTLREIFRELAHELLDVDGKIFRSTVLLFSRPGFLTRERVAGRKARYVSPVRLYLFFSIAFFGVQAIALRYQPIFAPDEVAAAGELGDAIGLEDATAAVANAAAVEQQAIWAPRVAFLLLPVSALLVWLVTRSARRNYPQQLYFAMHAHAAYFGLATVTTLLNLLGVRWLDNALFFATVLALVVYLTVAFRVAYGGAWHVAVGRAVFVSLGYLCLLIFAIVASVAIVVRAAA